MKTFERTEDLAEFLRHNCGDVFSIETECLRNSYRYLVNKIDIPKEILTTDDLRRELKNILQELGIRE